MVSAYGINVSGNNITTTTADAIRIDSGCENIQITGNALASDRLCINENNTDSENIEISNNTCAE